ncbi:MAG: leucine-rich repeat domain-containing protein [Clostridia bacterium]|nr:leucine-rich repeat domain-containing protein [Clostridia bacterium]
MKRIISILLIVASITVLFASCKPSKEKVIVSGNYTYVALEDNTAKITKYSCSDEMLVLEIPSAIDDMTVTVIGSGAFKDVQNIGAVTFPETITLIETDAFTGSSIKKAYLHRCSALTEIQEKAFAECHNLIQVDLPKNLETIGEGAFYYCDSLKVANFRGNTPNIHQFAFDACPKVKIYTKSDMMNVINFAQTYHVELSVSD